ncbi:hypothetical protein EVAR_87_1 [Eumeta japonica]|uniref:Uncharacterized protein n=1 Tax=Eumeta variegata TaxID=151549 RepID=A0A4C1SBI8_EUMVA|nr:hypothetical protein EVAR_87_1 [Eumeta japonica]
MENERDKVQPSVSYEKFVGNWNAEFSNYILSIADLKKPISVLGALLQIFAKLGIDLDAVLAPPPENERDEHTPYYWDLIPVINVTRVIRHLALGLQQFISMDDITISHLLNATTTYPILLFFFNLMVFQSSQLQNIAPYEKEFFGKQDEVKALENEKNKLIEMLNIQAKEKGERAERLRKIDYDTKQLEEELMVEKEAHEKENKDSEALIEEIRHLEVSVEQKKAHCDAILTEVARKRALRVYDAEDIRAQAEQAQANLQETQEKMESLKANLTQKESSLRNLQNIKPNLDAANNYLYEITKQLQTLKELEGADAESEGPDDELVTLASQLKDVSTELAEVRAARAERAAARADADEKRRQERAEITAALEAAQMQDKKCTEELQKTLARIEELKRFTEQYEEERSKLMTEMRQIHDDFIKQLQLDEDTLLKQMLKAEKHMENIIKKNGF